MRALFTNVTAVLLFIHAVLGCCWHHAHECANCGAAHAAAAAGPTGFARSAPGLLGCHHCDSDDQGEPAGPCRCKFECQGVCTYLPPQKSGLDAAVCGADFDLWTITANPVAVRLGEAASRGDSSESPIVATGLRPHLLYQVLVI